MRPLTMATMAFVALTLVAGLLYSPLWLYVTFAGLMVMMHMGGHGGHGHGGFQHAHPGQRAVQARAAALQQTGTETGGLGITVTPLSLSNDKVVELEVRAGSASGDVGSDVVRAAHLTDSNGMNYSPLAWNGHPASRGSGVLSFPSLEGEPNSVRLVLQGFRGVDRAFEWSLGG